MVPLAYVLLAAITLILTAQSPSTIAQPSHAEQIEYAPTWGKHRPNGHYTIRRGVAVNDADTPPSDRELDSFRREYWRHHRILKFTLVEGEQIAPVGPNGRMVGIDVRPAHAFAIGDRSIPSVSVTTIDGEAGFLGMTMMGTLPMELSTVVEANSRRACEYHGYTPDAHRDTTSTVNVPSAPPQP